MNFQQPVSSQGCLRCKVQIYVQVKDLPCYLQTNIVISIQKIFLFHYHLSPAYSAWRQDWAGDLSHLSGLTIYPIFNIMRSEGSSIKTYANKTFWYLFGTTNFFPFFLLDTTFHDSIIENCYESSNHNRPYTPNREKKEGPSNEKSQFI